MNPPRLRAGLPDGPTNGLTDHSERLLQQPDTELVVVALLRRDGYVHDDKTKVDTPFLRIHSVDVLDEQDSQWARELLHARRNDRQLAGQLELQTEPTELAELMAEFHELADTLDVDVAEFKARFADTHDGTVPEGVDHPQTLRQWLSDQRGEHLPLPGRPAGDVAPVTFTSESPESVDA